MADDILRNALAEQNAVTFLADGPRLSHKYHVWVDARDRELGWVLLGLGGCGFKALTVTRSYWDELVAEDIARNAGKP